MLDIEIRETHYFTGSKNTIRAFARVLRCVFVGFCDRSLAGKNG
jgi:hypothetical protein